MHQLSVITLNTLNTSLLVSIIALVTLLSISHGAETLIVVETDYGNIDIKLYDDLAPITVANFKNYIRSGAFDNNIFHRSVTDFILQSGGFFVTEPPNSNFLGSVATAGPIQNEFGISNTRGTLAMAKLPGDPDSATSGWFINLADNSANLDNQNGGFTVFGEVLDMSVVDTIAATRIVNAGGVFTDLPIKDLDHPDSSGVTPSSGSIQRSDLVTIQSITIIPEPSSIALISLFVFASILVRRR